MRDMYWDAVQPLSALRCICGEGDECGVDCRVLSDARAKIECYVVDMRNYFMGI